MSFITAHTVLIGQLFGILAMITALIMYQFKKHRTIMLLMLLCSTFWCIHFAFLGAMTGVIMNVINVARALVFTQREKPWCSKLWIPAAFTAASVVAVICTWESAYSLLPCVASIAATLGSWQKNTQRLRLFTIVVCVCWFAYNAIKGSWAGMANEIFTLFSVLLALWRYHFHGEPEAADENGEALPADGDDDAEAKQPDVDAEDETTEDGSAEDVPADWEDTDEPVPLNA